MAKVLPPIVVNGIRYRVLRLEGGKYGVQEGRSAEPDRIVGRQGGLLGGLGDRGSGFVFRQMCGVERETGDPGYYARADAVRVQERTLLALVRKARGTRFGRDHGFGSIRSVADFRLAVPLRT